MRTVRGNHGAMGVVTVYHRLFDQAHEFLRRNKETVLVPVGSVFDVSEVAETEFPGVDAYLSAWEGVITVSAKPEENIVHLEYTAGQLINNGAPTGSGRSNDKNVKKEEQRND